MSITLRTGLRLPAMASFLLRHRQRCALSDYRRELDFLGL
jgi:hypothetical protein